MRDLRLINFTLFLKSSWQISWYYLNNQKKARWQRETEGEAMAWVAGICFERNLAKNWLKDKVPEGAMVVATMAMARCKFKTLLACACCVHVQIRRSSNRRQAFSAYISSNALGQQNNQLPSPPLFPLSFTVQTLTRRAFESSSLPSLIAFTIIVIVIIVFLLALILIFVITECIRWALR